MDTASHVGLLMFMSYEISLQNQKCIVRIEFKKVGFAILLPYLCLQ